MDSLQEILFTLKQNKLRTALTAFGVFWGIFMLVLLLGAGKGMQNGVYDDFSSDAMDFIVIYTSTTSVAYEGMGLGRQILLTKSDLEAMPQQVPGVGFIADENQRGGVTMIYDKKQGSFNVHGVPDEYFELKNAVPFTFGRKMNDLDESNTRKIAVIGSVVAERLFEKNEDPVGRDIKVNGVMMKVVGVFHDKGNNGRDSERIYIPATTFSKMFGTSDRIGSIWIRPASGIDGYELEKNAIAFLQKRHQVSPEDKRAIRSFNMAEAAARVNGVFIGIAIINWFVGLGTLLAGIVGVSNIMIITVKERTREIGIRKALGATPFNIVGTLVFESILVTSLAGYVGLVLGVGLIELIGFGLRASGAEMPYFKNPEIDFQMAITAMILLVIAGAIAGLIPAARAAKIMPIEAMRAD
jgi:putative ABC transport system permease protein